MRVARPGPEARFGGRMVGTIGTMENISAQLSLAASHGNINIDVQQAKSQYPRKDPQQEPPQKVGHPHPTLPAKTLPWTSQLQSWASPSQKRQ